MFTNYTLKNFLEDNIIWYAEIERIVQESFLKILLDFTKTKN